MQSSVLSYSALNLETISYICYHGSVKTESPEFVFKSYQTRAITSLYFYVSIGYKKNVAFYLHIFVHNLLLITWFRKYKYKSVFILSKFISYGDKTE